MEALIMLVVFALIIIWLFFYFVSYVVHKQMVKESCRRWGRASYKKFVQEFEKHLWDSRMWSGSLFDYSTDSKYHASIIQFNGIGMAMRTWIDWALVLLYIRRYIKKLNKSIPYKW